ncbi:CNNM domain-containing protein [Halomarina litorea]|uniref:CNNM domain-containing protein n=1 Tax=Halomarina litorea TaxID=2961595 RepID=UPI0020C40959|nr:hemolysin family protein [Halomarina sp. BCD28]
MVEFVTLLALGVGIFLLLGNAFFVVSEFAMTRVRQFPESEFRGTPGLERAWEMTEQLEIYLSGCQVGITICSVGLGYVAEPALAALIDPAVKAVGLSGLLGGGGEGGHTLLSVILALVVINLFHIVVGEQAPTYLGVERTKLVCKYCAWPLYLWGKVMYPAIALSDRIAKALLGLFGVTIERSWADEEAEGEGSGTTPGEVRRQMGERLSGLGLTQERREEVLAAIDIDFVSVNDIMIPTEDIVALRAGDSFEENLERMSTSPHSRFPLIGDSLSDFRGVVYAPAVLRELDALREGGTTLEDIAAPPMTVEAAEDVADLIDRFQEEAQELALVTGGEPDDDESVEDPDADSDELVGLVTATDCFEAITGELEDPLDRAETTAGGSAGADRRGSSTPTTSGDD